MLHSHKPAVWRSAESESYIAFAGAKNELRHCLVQKIYLLIAPDELTATSHDFLPKLIFGNASGWDENAQRPRHVATYAILVGRTKALGKALVDFVIETHNSTQALGLAVVRRLYPRPLL